MIEFEFHNCWSKYEAVKPIFMFQLNWDSEEKKFYFSFAFLLIGFAITWSREKWVTVYKA